MMHPTTKSSEIQGSLYWMPLVDMIAAWRASCTAMAPCKASNSISSSACCSLILWGEAHERVVVARVEGRRVKRNQPKQSLSRFQCARGGAHDFHDSRGVSALSPFASLLIWTNPIEAPGWQRVRRA